MQDLIKPAWPGALVDAETLQYELWGECKQPQECQVVVHEPDSFNRGGITVTFGSQLSRGTFVPLSHHRTCHLWHTAVSNQRLRS